MTLPEPTVSALTNALATTSVTAESQALSHGTWLLTLSVRLPAESGTVWAHITQPKLLAGWSPIVPDRALTEVGPVTSREFPDAPEVDVRVIEASPCRVLRHAWGDGEVLWELTGGGAGAVGGDAATAGGSGGDVRDPVTTPLSVTQTFSHSDAVPVAAAGWHICLTVLALQLDGRHVERVVGEDAMAVGWEALRDAYARGLTSGSADHG